MQSHLAIEPCDRLGPSKTDGTETSLCLGLEVGFDAGTDYLEFGQGNLVAWRQLCIAFGE